jgi:hypothetical protein
MHWLHYTLSMDVLMLMLFFLRSFLFSFAHVLLRNDLDATVHAGGLIEAVWETKLAALLIHNDSSTLQSMVASAVLRMGTGVAHSYGHGSYRNTRQRKRQNQAIFPLFLYSSLVFIGFKRKHKGNHRVSQRGRVVWPRKRRDALSEAGTETSYPH